MCRYSINGIFTHVEVKAHFQRHTKPFDFVNRGGLFMVLIEIGCPLRQQSMIESVNTIMKGTAQFNSSSSGSLDTRSGIIKGCVLAPTLFGIFFALLPKRAFDPTTEGSTCVLDQTAGCSTSPASEPKQRCMKPSSETLFADDAAVGTHIQQELKSLMDRFTQSCIRVA